MATLINNAGVQHYANKMVLAENRKVGSKSLPTALADIDNLIDEMKTQFDAEYGSALDMELENNENVFSVGTGTNIDKRSEVENSFTDVELSGNSLVNLIQEKSYLDWHVLYCGRKSSEGIFIGRGSKYSSQASPNNIASTDVRCKIISKNNSVYTLIFDAKVIEGTSSEFTIVYNGICIRNTAKIKDGRNVILIRSDDSQNGTFQIYEVTGDNNESDINIRLTNIVILEGDWTNRPIPQYFEGMKSVGQDDVNGHKIEILSQNYQELNTDTNGLVCHLKAGTSAIINNIMSDLSGNGNNATLYGASMNGDYLNFDGADDYAEINRCISDDFTVSLKAEVISVSGGSLSDDSHWYNYAGLVDNEFAGVTNDFGLTMTRGGYPCLGIGKPDITIRHKETCFNKLTTFTYTRNKTTGEMKLYVDGKHSGTIFSTNKNSLNANPLLYIGCSSVTKSSFVKMKFYELKIYNKVLNESEIFKFNKKEILLNEPLRGLPNGIKDTIEKINGEWKVVRRCGSYTLTGAENELWKDKALSSVVEDVKGFEWVSNLPIVGREILCDNLAVEYEYTNHLYKAIRVYQPNSGIVIVVNKSDLSSMNVNGFRLWLQQNSPTIIYELETPIIEDISPVTLQCWKNGTISIDEVLPVETTHTVALNKPAQIKRNIEELTALRKRVQALEDFYDQVALEQSHQLSLINNSIELDYDI